jgi:hypothetical protein
LSVLSSVLPVSFFVSTPLGQLFFAAFCLQALSLYFYCPALLLIAFFVSAICSGLFSLVYSSSGLRYTPRLSESATGIFR